MDERLKEVLEGKGGNYLLPFLWMHEGGREELPERIQKVWDSGCRAFCVESRPHEGFGKQSWWDDMTVILEEARKKDMKVWILDDKHFPTGYANGILKEKYPERRRWFLTEHHMDVIGPMPGTSILMPQMNEKEEEQLLAVVAYRRGDSGELLEGEGILLEDMSEGFLFWDVPEGDYRIFFLIQTRRGGGQEYISCIDGDSVHALIEAVYEPHYEHFSRYFGNTLVGFFSDEPTLASPHLGPWGVDAGFYYRTVGQPGVGLPWSHEVLGEMAAWAEDMEAMEAEEESSMLKYLPGLWYPMTENRSARTRLCYMDVITKLWQRYFSMQLGEWCREHGVSYIGHIIEDMNAHMRLGCSGGHYFRSLSGQDMSGIDIVLHQVMPGFADYEVSASISGGKAGNAFFHYVLPKLGSSLARVEPRMRGAAMCEVFGAYGWAEDTACMKWLMDFLLVRGINRFVPHAFTDLYPDPDCPPHFYGKGNNPQYEGFSKLMRYVNQVSHLLEGADLQTDGSVFYMAEAEWMSTPGFRDMDGAAKALYDAHIDFDILPLDALESAKVENRKLMVNGHAHRFLVIPYAERYPQKLYRLAEEFSRNAFPVFWLTEDGVRRSGSSGTVWLAEEGARLLEGGETIGLTEDRVRLSEGGETIGLTENGERRSDSGESIGLVQLAAAVRERGLAHQYTTEVPQLRIGHFVRGTASWFMLFWESVQGEVDEVIELPCKGDFLRLNLLHGEISRGSTADGRVRVRLIPYQSELLLFDDFPETVLEGFSPRTEWKELGAPALSWDIELLEQGKEGNFRKVKEQSELFSITGREGWPRFSGRMRYRTRLRLEGDANVALDLGRVGVTAKLAVNGKDLGMRICPPYRWDITEAAIVGDNLIEVEVCNTLVHRIQDGFSRYMQIPPSGLLGPVRLYGKEDALGELS